MKKLLLALFAVFVLGSSAWAMPPCVEEGTIVPVAMADGNATLTTGQLLPGSFISNVSWTAGHTVILPLCNVSISGAGTTLGHITTYAIKVRPNAANKILGLTTVNGTAAAIASPIAGDYISLKCVKSGAATYDWFRWWVGSWASD